MPPTSSSTVPAPKLLRVQRNPAAGTPNFRIFKIRPDAGPSVTVTISGLTISNGIVSGLTVQTGAGGGIYNGGTLTLDSCVINANHAGFGGGIVNLGVLTIVRSTITDNAATDNGGGIANTAGDGSATLTIDASTISNNLSSAQGGGLYDSAALLTNITNTTVSSNNAVIGGGIANFNQMVIRNATVTANNGSTRGGGIRAAAGVVKLSNTIVAENTSPDGRDASGTNFTSEDYNIIGFDAGFQMNGEVTHNLTMISPRLGPLTDNGGPTPTHELLDGSPAIDAGFTNLFTDQRGFPRPVDSPLMPNVEGGDASDIGAYEAPVFEVNSTDDTTDGFCTLIGTGDGCTLRDAISVANATAGAEQITFKTSLTTGGPVTITLLSALPDLASDMTITGPGADLLTIERSTADGTPKFRIFTINSGRTVNISNLTAAKGHVLSPNNGGAVLNNGTLTLTNCNIYGSTAEPSEFGGHGEGGGIMNLGALTVNNCNVGGTEPSQKNTAVNGGGGVWHQLGTFSMNGGTISGNTGGGLYALQGTVALNGVAVTSNTSHAYAGVSLKPLTTIVNCLIADNVVTGFGAGGLYNSGAEAQVINTTITGNSSAQSGGGIYMHNNGKMTLTNVTVTNNRSNSDNTGNENGGGVNNDFGTLTLNNTIVAGNFRGGSPSTTADDVGGTVDPASSNNLIGVGGAGGLVNGVNNNLVGVANPGLGPLAANGGLTLTYALLPASRRWMPATIR